MLDVGVFLEDSRFAWVWGGLLDKLGQDGVGHAVKRLGDQRGANRAGGIAAADGKQTPSPVTGHRWALDEVAGEVEDVLQIVFVAFPGNGVVDEAFDALRRKTYRAAYARMPLVEDGQRHQSNSILYVRFYDESSLFPFVEGIHRIADVESRMGPSRLGQVLDRYAEATSSFHQNHVALAQSRLEYLGGIGCPANPLLAGLRKVAGQLSTDSAE